MTLFKLSQTHRERNPKHKQNNVNNYINPTINPTTNPTVFNISYILKEQIYSLTMTVSQK